MTRSETQLPEAPIVADPQSWPAAVEALLEPLYRFVRARAPLRAVDDLVQETFVAAARGIRGFDGRCPLWNWLTAIARNKIAEYYRRTASRDVVTEALDTFGPDDTPMRPALVSESPLPDEICEREEFSALARLALSALSPEQQECLVARYYEGLSLPELARRLGLSTAAINTRLHRARNDLRTVFQSLLTRQSDGQERAS